MTEKEKMLSGEMYDCSDKELISRNHEAKNLTRILNNLPSEDLKGKNEIIKKLLGSFGESIWITPPFYVDYGENIHIGKGCEINWGCSFLDNNKITIGDNALIAPNVQIYTACHPTNAAERLPLSSNGEFAFCVNFSKPVTIGNNVWIGGGAIILPGVTIGDNVVIGAGSVVTKDIPSNVIAVGNPCKVIKDNI